MSKSITYPNISFCIPVHNEEKYLLIGIKRIKNGLNKIIGENRFEIIIVDNGSTDNTPNIIKKIKSENIKTFSIKKKGSGVAFREALKESKYQHVIFNAIDLPFGFSDLKNVVKIWDKYDLIYGSKALKNSIYFTSKIRRISSFVYRNLLKIFFNLKIKDTQGSVFLKKSKILPLLKYCDSDNAFFTSQLAIYANLSLLKVTEVPVTMRKHSYRKSKFSLGRDGSDMFLSMLKEYTKIQNLLF